MLKKMFFGFYVILLLSINIVLAQDKIFYDPWTDIEENIRVENGKNVNRAIISTVKNVPLENGSLIRKEDAESLINKTWNGQKLFSIVKLQEDQEFDIFIDDYNFTSIREFRIEVINTSKIGETIPIKTNGEIKSSILLSDVSTKISQDVIFDNGFLGNNFTVGSKSEILTVIGNQTTMEDTKIYEYDPDRNAGAESGDGYSGIGHRESDFQTDMRIFVRPTHYNPILGETIINVSFKFYGDTDLGGSTQDLTFFSIEDYWQEGNLTASAGDASWNERISGTSWNAGNDSIGYLMAQITGAGGTTGSYAYQTDLPAVWGQNVIDNAYGVNDSFLIMNQFGEGTGADNYIEMLMSEELTKNTPEFYWEYEQSTGPCDYISGNWNVECSDICDISSNVNGDSGATLHLSGTGSFTINGATIHGFDKLHFDSSQCTIHKINGGRLEIS